MRSVEGENERERRTRHGVRSREGCGRTEKRVLGHRHPPAVPQHSPLSPQWLPSLLHVKANDRRKSEEGKKNRRGRLKGGMGGGATQRAGKTRQLPCSCGRRVKCGVGTDAGGVRQGERERETGRGGEARKAQVQQQFAAFPEPLKPASLALSVAVTTRLLRLTRCVIWTGLAITGDSQASRARR